MKKRLLSLLICLCLTMGLLPATVFAQGSPYDYVALGDSISTGYGLAAGEASFVSQLADQSGLTVLNLAQNGATTQDVWNTLEGLEGADKSALENARLITLTVGGNDLMGALYTYLADTYNQANDTSYTAQDIQLALTGDASAPVSQLAVLLHLSTSLKSFVDTGMAEALEQFQADLIRIVQTLRTLNPTAQIILTNQYNPYGILKNVTSFSSLADQFDTGVGKLNAAIQAAIDQAGVEHLTLVDVYTPFQAAIDRGENPCNANATGLSDINPDFHPNALGHTLMAQAVAAALDLPDTATDIQVGGVTLQGSGTAPAYALTPEGVVTTEGASADNWSVKWDGSTLTLNNAQISSPSGIFYDGGSTLFLVLRGSSTVGTAPDITISGSTNMTVTVKPDSDYVLQSLTVTDGQNQALPLTGPENGGYTFTMPEGTVTVSPTIARGLTFTDVSPNAYYYDAVAWAVEKGVANGTGDTTFTPDRTVSRGEMITFLWRAAGSPAAEGENPFTDVTETDYYYQVALWAVQNGIAKGSSATTFSPLEPVTRAQAVTFQWRASGAPAVSGHSFDDVPADAYYAQAVAWAAQNQIDRPQGQCLCNRGADSGCARGVGTGCSLFGTLHRLHKGRADRRPWNRNHKPSASHRKYQRCPSCNLYAGGYGNGLGHHLHGIDCRHLCHTKRRDFR